MSRPLRYVVLHHTGVAEPHYDFMLAIDDAGPLLTWRLSRWPPGEDDRATPIASHRRVYLEYEGPVSGQRGVVKRVAAGQAELFARTAGSVTIQLDGATTLTLPTAT